ncbi:MAG: hypothetical protein ACD_78C00206G0001, partial [uncultured bacterium (gcode 4)]
MKKLFTSFFLTSIIAIVVFWLYQTSFA